MAADDSSTYEGILQDQGLRARALYDYQAGLFIHKFALGIKYELKGTFYNFVCNSIIFLYFSINFFLNF